MNASRSERRRTARGGHRPAGRATGEVLNGGTVRDRSRASADVAELSTRQQQVRDELLGRSGARIIVETGNGSEPFELTRFDPINLLVLGGGQVAHPNSVVLTRPEGTVEVTNTEFARGSFSGTVTLTAAAGRNPLADGIRMLTIVGVKGIPKVDQRDGRLTIEAEGVRLALRGAAVRTEGDALRVTLPALR